jgi:hypothetical protein
MIKSHSERKGRESEKSERCVGNATPFPEKLKRGVKCQLRLLLFC